MNKLEYKLSSNTIYPYLLIFIYHWYIHYVCTVFLYKHTKNFKYIHDIFLLFTGTNNKPDQFLNDLNKTQHSIKFHYSVSQNHIAFLNVEIYLHTKIYRRETDQQQYLHIKSDHSKSMKEQSRRPNQVNKFQWSRWKNRRTGYNWHFYRKRQLIKKQTERLS